VLWKISGREELTAVAALDEIFTALDGALPPIMQHSLGCHRIVTTQEKSFGAPLGVACKCRLQSAQAQAPD